MEARYLGGVLSLLVFLATTPLDADSKPVPQTRAPSPETLHPLPPPPEYSVSKPAKPTKPDAPKK